MSTLEYDLFAPQLGEQCYADKKLLIQGVTHSGEQFRPSDWAERVSGGLCTFENQRIQYSPLLHPTIHNGNKCVRLDPALQKTNPQLYQTIVDFVEQNDLQVCVEEETLPN